MYRKFYDVLINWKKKNTKEPLLVTGTRQVGKTWIIDRFCREQFSDYASFNFESNPELDSVFSGSLEPDHLLRQLSILAGRQLTSDTVLFFDEIQRCERAITSLKYFCESAQEYHVIGAGSLLGVKLNRFESSFPVGKVQILQMFPMDFEEFLLAAGQKLLLEEIRRAYESMTGLSEALHQRAMQYYRDYLYVGGMPQCVCSYVDSGCNVMQFNRSLQEYITLAYSADMSKYTYGAAEGPKISAVYQSVPRQLARENPKFKYTSIRPYANRRDFTLPLDWLLSAGMIIKVTKAELPMAPLKAFADDNAFKVYLSDTGLLAYLSGLEYRDLLPSAENIFKGAVTENFIVVQTLLPVFRDLYYFKSDPSMEIDLLINTEKGIVPIEIKSGRNKRSVSLKNYEGKYSPERMIRISENNFGKAGKLLSVPLYAAFCINQALL